MLFWCALPIIPSQCALYTLRPPLHPMRTTFSLALTTESYRCTMCDTCASHFKQAQLRRCKGTLAGSWTCSLAVTVALWRQGKSQNVFVAYPVRRMALFGYGILARRRSRASRPYHRRHLYGACRGCATKSQNIPNLYRRACWSQVPCWLQ